MTLSVVICHSGDRRAVEASIANLSAAHSGQRELLLAGSDGSIMREFVASPRRTPPPDWWRLALAECDGDYVIFVSAGDIFAPGSIDHALAVLAAFPNCAFAYGKSLPSAALEFADCRFDSEAVEESVYLRLLARDFLHQSAVLYRRSVLGMVAQQDPVTFAAANLAVARTHEVVRSRRFVAIVEDSNRRPRAKDLSRLVALAAERKQTHASRSAERARREGCANELRSHMFAAFVQLRATARAPTKQGGHTLRQLCTAGMAALRYPAGLGSVVTREFVPWLWRRSKGLRRLATTTSAPHRGELDATQHARIAIETLGGAEAKVLYSGDAAHRLDGTDWDYVVAPVGEDWGPGHTKPSIGSVVWSDNRVSVLKRRGAPPGASSGRALVTGYFSFERGHATAGDIEAQQLVTDWLRRSGRTVDVATAPPFLGGVDWRSVAPEHYDCVFFVCGPFRREPEILEMLRRFGHAKRIGLNLTLLAQHEWEDVLDRVFERDSVHTARPDMAYGADCAKVPIVGVCLREHSGRSDEGDALIAELLGSRALAAVPIDTRLDDLILDGNSTGLRTPAEVESLIARMDVIVTTRLHGLVMALKNSVPVLAIDPGNEGYKICRQAAAVGWPAAIALHNADSETLRLALNYCLSEQGRRDARQCGERGAASIESLKNDVLAAADPLPRA